MNQRIILFLIFLTGMFLNSKQLVAQTCAVPTGLGVMPRDTGATVSWSSANGMQKYYISWRERGSSASWLQDSTTLTWFRLVRLRTCTNYEVRIATKCSNSQSAWTLPTTFRTGNCPLPCQTPTSFYVSSVTNNSASLLWRSTRATIYELEYKATDSNAVTQRISVSSDTTVLLQNLVGCKEYRFRLRSICMTAGTTMYSDWSTNGIFSTECATPTCFAPSRIRVGNIGNNSITVNWDTLAGQSYEIQYLMSPDTVWTNLSTNIRSPYTINNLISCKSYNIRIRSVCPTQRSSWGNPVRITTGGCTSFSCEPPRNLSLRGFDTTILVVWNADPNMLNYVIQYGLRGENLQTVNVGRDGNFRLNGVLPCSPYIIRIASQCAPNTLSSWTDFMNVDTRGCSELCPSPWMSSTSLTDSTVITWYWEGTASGKYQISYREANDSTGRVTIDSVMGNRYQRRLSPCMTYLFKVRQICGNNIFSNWSNLSSFRTICSSSQASCYAPINLTAEVDSLSAILSWNGNPSRYAIEIRDSANNVFRRDTVSQPWFIVQNLAGCRRYSASVKNLCTLQSSAVASVAFRTICPNTCNLQLSSLPVLVQNCVGNSLAFVISANNAGAVYYQWQRSANGVVWGDISGETRPTLSRSDFYIGTTFVRVRVSSPNCPQPVFSNVSRIVSTVCQPSCTEVMRVTPIIDSISVSLNITPIIESGSLDSFEVQYRNTTDLVWTRRTTRQSPYRLTGLIPCASYEARVRRLCGNDLTTWKTTVFTVPGTNCQQICQLFNAEFVYVDSSRQLRLITTPQILSNDTLHFRWRSNIGTDTLWRNQFILGNSWQGVLPITVHPCMNYDFQIRRICSNGMSPTLFHNFTVPGTNCGGSNCNILLGDLPNMLSICQNTPQTLVANVQGANYTIQWQMSQNNSTWTSLPGATVNTFNVPTNNIGTLFIRYVVNSPNCTIPRISNVSKIINTLCCPEIQSVTTLDSANITWLFVTPNIVNAPNDNFEVRFRKHTENNWTLRTYRQAPIDLPRLDTCVDYIIQVRRNCNNGEAFTRWKELTYRRCGRTAYFECPAPRVSFHSDSILSFGHGLAPQDSFFQINVRDTLTNLRWTFTTRDTTFNVNRINPINCRYYTFEVNRKCSNSALGWNWYSAYNLKRGDCPQLGPCEGITNLVLRDTTNGRVALVATPNNMNGSLDSFVVNIPTPNNNVIALVFSQSPMILPRLDTCRTYSIYVSRMCNNRTTSAARAWTYTTRCLQGGGSGTSNQRAVVTNNESFTLYPNPTNEILNLNYQLSEASEVRFDILNLQGQMVRTIQLGTQEKGGYQQSIHDITALQTGFYLMTMRINGKIVATQKWQKF